MMRALAGVFFCREFPGNHVVTFFSVEARWQHDAAVLLTRSWLSRYVPVGTRPT